MSEENGGSDPSFEERLQAARSKQGLDAPPKQPLGNQGGARRFSVGNRLAGGG